MTKGVVWETLRKWQAATKRTSGNEKMPRTAKKGVGKLTAAQGENTELSARKTAKVRKSHRLNTAKCFENKNSEYTIEYTKNITNIY